MRRIALAFIFMIACAAPAASQFAESQTPCHGCTQDEAARLAKIRGVLASQAIGGPVGVPTIVMPPAKSAGFIQIGQAFGDFLQPYIDAAIQAIIAALVGWLAWKLKQSTGIDIDAGHRDAITKALTNQASSLVADGMVKIEDGKVDVHSAALAAAAKEVMAVVPDAAKHFGVTPEFVAARIVDTIPQIAAGAQLIVAHAVGKLKLP